MVYISGNNQVIRNKRLIEFTKNSVYLLEKFGLLRSNFIDLSAHFCSYQVTANAKQFGFKPLTINKTDLTYSL